MTNHIQHAEAIDNLRSIDKTLDKMLAAVQTISGAVALFEEDKEGPITQQEWCRMSADERSTEHHSLRCMPPQPAPEAEPELRCPLCGAPFEVSKVGPRSYINCRGADCGFDTLVVYAVDFEMVVKLARQILKGGK